MSDYALFIAVFLACVVEAVEATTIVLAAGTARDWRSALWGLAAGIGALAVIIVIFGPTISLLPLQALRLVVGGLLLVFGLQWMRKAILRASGYKALHDEEAIYLREVAEARAAGGAGAAGVDWYAFTLSFKGVLLEGLEVAFIVLTFGTIQHRIVEASLAALAAVVVVAIAGLAVRGPLSRVPENTMKFIVGVMLTSFGIFWGAEGAGAEWPGSDFVLLIIVPSVAVVSLAFVLILRLRRRRRDRMAPAPRAKATIVAGSAKAIVEDVAAPDLAAPEVASSSLAGAPTTRAQLSIGRRFLAFGAFLYDFVVGDDWLIAVGIVAAFALTAWFAAIGSAAWIVVPLAVFVLLPLGTLRALRR